MASIDSAKKAFEERNYQIAYEEFMKYARIGNAQAQYYIGLMYYQGKGTKADIYEANAWFGLAREGGYRNAIDMMQRLRRELPSKREAKSVLQDIESLYGEQALSETLFPILTNDNLLEQQLTPLKVKTPQVPDTSGWVLINVNIDENGFVHSPKVLASYPEGVFDTASLSAAREWRFKSQQVGEQMEQINDYVIKFEFKSSNVRSHQKYLRSLNKYTDTLKITARSGNADAQYLLSRLYGQGIMRPKMSDKIRTATAWLLEAAKSGHAKARFELANRLLDGRGVQTDPVKAYLWLEMAANDNYGPALTMLAREILLNYSSEAEYSKAVDMLEKAVIKGDENANQELGIIYATTVYDRHFDPYKSTQIAKSGLVLDDQHPDYLTVMAAAYSAQGSNQKASEVLYQAYASALNRGWPTSRLVSLAQQLAIDLDAQQVVATTANNNNVNVSQKSRVDSGESKPKLVPIDRIGPTYPDTAKDKHIEGWVKLSYSVNRNGLVEDIEILGAQPEEVFDEAAISALKQWRYEPIVENGKTVKVGGYKVKLAFTLQN
ncbi:TonB family protein [Saccharobesus litoralis]|nr:TonB family protein [Saccharobesus litoralis]